MLLVTEICLEIILMFLAEIGNSVLLGAGAYIILVNYMEIRIILTMTITRLL